MLVKCQVRRQVESYFCFSFSVAHWLTLLFTNWTFKWPGSNWLCEKRKNSIISWTTEEQILMGTLVLFHSRQVHLCVSPFILQGSRLDDQRCAAPPAVNSGPTVPDEDFFGLIVRSQSNRMEEQRVPPPPVATQSKPDWSIQDLSSRCRITDEVS